MKPRIKIAPGLFLQGARPADRRMCRGLMMQETLAVVDFLVYSGRSDSSTTSF